MKDYTIIYDINDIYKIYKARKGQIAGYICFALIMLVVGVVLNIFIENDGLYLLSASLLMLLFVTYSLYIFLLKLPKSKWYCDLFITLDDGYKTITPLRYVKVKPNDDKTQKVIFTKLDNDEIVELLLLNNMEVTLKQENYYICQTFLVKEKQLCYNMGIQ